MRNYIHINLCISLFVAQLVFVIGIDKAQNKVSFQSYSLNILLLITILSECMHSYSSYSALLLFGSFHVATHGRSGTICDSH